MRGSSRAAFAAGHDAFVAALGSGADWTALAEDLFGITAALDASASLRRALADPSREASAKRELVGRLFGGKVGDAALSVLAELWPSGGPRSATSPTHSSGSAWR